MTSFFLVQRIVSFFFFLAFVFRRSLICSAAQIFLWFDLFLFYFLFFSSFALFRLSKPPGTMEESPPPSLPLPITVTSSSLHRKKRMNEKMNEKMIERMIEKMTEKMNARMIERLSIATKCQSPS